MNSLEISVTPPESLVKFDAPLFVGIEQSAYASASKAVPGTETASKMDDMINSMLPPRYGLLSFNLLAF
jgi:hypothetical protein